jgi:meso-butanediol dehydrogenase/(S,S)-butanediol dehydrogenase/diacetyl reductase
MGPKRRSAELVGAETETWRPIEPHTYDRAHVHLGDGNFMSGSGRLAGKRVLITGTGSGQGAAAQRWFCEEGAAVAGCDISEGRAESQATSLRAEGFEAYGRTADVADPEAAQAWVDWGVEELGGLDVLYNNASAADFAPFEEMTGAIWEFSMRNELDLVFYVTLAAWKHLQAGGGSIINVASASGMIADATLGQSAHTVTKAGVIALSRQLAAEGGPHSIRVNAISPGYIQTPATSDHPGALRQYMLDQQFLKRLATPEDVIPMAVYLASDESRFVTGANFVIDGGWTVGAPHSGIDFGAPDSST